MNIVRMYIYIHSNVDKNKEREKKLYVETDGVYSNSLP